MTVEPLCATTSHCRRDGQLIQNKRNSVFPVKALQWLELLLSKFII